MDHITPENNRSQMPSYRIDTTTDGFKFELLTEMVDEYMNILEVLADIKELGKEVVVRNLEKNYDPAKADKKKRRKLWWKKFLMDSEAIPGYGSGKLRGLEENTYIKHLCAMDVQIDHVPVLLGRLRVPEDFYVEQFTYDQEHTFKVNGKYFEDVGLVMGCFNQCYYQDFTDKIYEFSNLKDRINKGKDLFVDRIYVDEQIVQDMCWIDLIKSDFDIYKIREHMRNMLDWLEPSC